MKATTFTHAVAIACLATASLAPAAHAADAGRETIAPAFAYPIANVQGKTMTAITVTYAPGARTPPHRHAKAFVVGYVLEGAIRSKLAGGEEKIYRAGESWTEAPGAHHLMSDNASATEPARLLAIFIADKNEKNLVTVESDQPGK